MSKGPTELFQKKCKREIIKKMTELFQKNCLTTILTPIKASHFLPPHCEASKQNFLKRKDLGQKDEFFGFSLVFLHSEYG